MGKNKPFSLRFNRHMTPVNVAFTSLLLEAPSSLKLLQNPIKP
jgi:hypothetical protein